MQQTAPGELRVEDLIGMISSAQAATSTGPSRSVPAQPEMDSSSNSTHQSYTPLPGETMSAYYNRLRQLVTPDHPHFRRMDAITVDGLYLHKRPVSNAGPDNPLGIAGTVYYHCTLYIKQGDKLHSLDLAPAHGGDTTSNLLESTPAKQVLARDTCVPAGDTLPFLYLGSQHLGLEHDKVHRAISFAESRPYNAITNNCIHFAEFMVHVLLEGRVAGAVHVYDVLCGSAPQQEIPMLLMLQMMMQMSWAAICDARMLLRAFTEVAQQQQQAAAVSAS